jgi:glycosyltransferase involved in cell wall biosynthesis
MRVLHGPVNVGNQPWVLSRHERGLGVDSDLVVNYSTWFGYPADRCLSSPGKRTPSQVARRLLFGMSSPFRYDVLHYYFGRSFLCWEDYGGPKWFWFADLKLAKRLGRKVFLTLQGCDARLSADSARRNRHTPCHLGRCEAALSCRSVLDAQRRFMIEHIAPRVDRVFVLNPELAQFVPGSVFLPYCSVDVEAFEPVWPRTDGPAVILHAPSDQSIKGSHLVIAAVERLKKRYPIEFILVKGVPYQDALKLYRRADLIVDQLYTGWYGGFAVEAMALGKPVGCYLRDEDLSVLPAAMRAELPLVRLDPDAVEADLETALRHRQLWPLWGRRSRQFVLRWHHPPTLAAAMIAAYRDPVSTFNLGAEPFSCAA